MNNLSSGIFDLILGGFLFFLRASGLSLSFRDSLARVIKTLILSKTFVLILTLVLMEQNENNSNDYLVCTNIFGYEEIMWKSELVSLLASRDLVDL